MQRITQISLPLGLLLAITFFSISTFQPKVDARPKYNKEFRKLYADAHIKKMWKKHKCNVCHIKGKEKDAHNAYGEVLKEILKKPNIKNKTVIKKALLKAEKKQLKAGKKFGELIKAGKHPTGL